MLSTKQMAAFNDVNRTPLLPSYYSYGMRASKSKSRKTTSGFGMTHAREIAKTLKLKTTQKGKRLSLKQLISKITASLKSKTKQNQAKEVIQKTAKHVKVPLTRQGKKVSVKSLWTKIQKKVVDVGSVTKKKNQVSRQKSSTKVRQPRSRKTRRNSHFGSWWDNTQKNYCLGGQCQSADQVGSGLPYKGEWPPYSSIKGSAFGFDPTLDTPALNSYPYLPEGSFPSALSNPYPFVNNGFVTTNF